MSLHEKNCSEVRQMLKQKLDSSIGRYAMHHIIADTDYSFYQDLHELLTVTYGLPVWASYAIFGVATVLTGLLLGMVSSFIGLNNNKLLFLALLVN